MRVVVIGAGVVGLAVGRELAARGNEVFVLEATGHPGSGTTSRNSEVIHAGLYYRPGSLKADLCIEGRRILYDYLERRQVDFRKCGKLVVAVDPSELPALEALLANAKAAGAEGVDFISEAEARRRQPAVRSVGALWSAETGILDAAGLVRALRADLERADGMLVLHARVCGAERAGFGYQLAVEIGEESEAFDCDVVVNAAGLAADRVARLAFGDEPQAGLPSHRYVRGSYVRVWWPRAAAPPDCLVYPLPNHGGTGLGVHLTVDLSGGLRLGPDTEVLPDRIEDYTVAEAVVPRFVEAARCYLEFPPDVSFSPDFAGIRPVRDEETAFKDFYIAEESARGLPGWVNLIGIESPGLTASLAIGRYVSKLVG
jgi:L-2-hydroxyglutarate oxidase LhgO